jgi:hypothetical protein
LHVRDLRVFSPLLYQLSYLAALQRNDVVTRPTRCREVCLPLLTRLFATKSLRYRRVWYGALADLIPLEEAQAVSRLSQRLKTLVLPSLLVVDELGVLLITRDRAHAPLPAHEPPLRTGVHRAHQQQRLRGLGRHLLGADTRTLHTTTSGA